MKKRIINITLEFDMSDFSHDMITPKEEVWEAIKKDMIELYWDVEGYLGSEVEVIDQ